MDTFVSVLFFLLACSSLMFSGVNADGVSDDMQSLNAFKNSIKLDPQNVLSDWDQKASNPCNWTGISCLSGRVTGIALAGKNLSGTVSPYLGNLSSLQTLNLSSNNFYGGIPPSLGRLTNLTYLSLNKNHLSGSVPQELGNLSSLLSIHLAHNFLTGVIPPSLAKIRSLNCLDMAYNHFESGFQSPAEQEHPIPLLEAFPNSSRLKDLQLQHNNFTGTLLPDMGLVFPLLQQFLLCYNGISGKIPGNIGNIPNLYKMDLGNNRFTGSLPNELGQCSRLDYLDVSDNNLSGSISIRITTLGSLRYLNLSLNDFSGGLPVSLGSMLQVVDVSHNNFSGQVPQWSFDVTANLSYNDLEGPIPCGSNSSSLFGNHRLTYVGCKKDRRSTKTIVLISASVVLFLLCCSVLLFCVFFLKKRRLRSDDSEPNKPSIDRQFMVLSHHELVKATGNFNPQNFLGKGKYGWVYRASLEGGNSVAVKIFSAFEDEETGKADHCFLRECETLGKIRHRNLVKVITACASEKVKALVLEFMPNGSLDGLLHRPIDKDGKLMPLSLRTRLRLLKEVASALSYLHHDCNPCIIHCDVKPQNVLLDEDMTARLSDFGMAKIMGDVISDVSRTLRLEGSIGYIAPEYGVGGTVSRKGDVFSFGVLMLEVLTRTRPTDHVLGPGMTLASWVGTALQKGREGIKERILPRKGQKELQTENEEENGKLEEALRLGMWCTCEFAEKRPTMRQVEGVLAAVAVDEADKQKTGVMAGNLEELIGYINERDDCVDSVIDFDSVKTFEDSTAFNSKSSG